MGFDLTKFFSTSIARPSNERGSIVKVHSNYNNRLKAHEYHLGRNDGVGISRFDTDTGANAGRLCHVDMSRSREEIRQQICDLYYNYHYTQQELADATGYAQSTISNIINGK